jgi:hypothetical protein
MVGTLTNQINIIYDKSISVYEASVYIKNFKPSILDEEQKRNNKTNQNLQRSKS